VPKGKHDLSHVDVGERHGFKRYRANAERHRSDPRYNLEHTTDLTLERLVASFIQHKSKPLDVGQAEWDRPAYRLTYSEAAFLTEKGYGRKDLESWAEIVSSQDSLTAADLLADLVASSTMKRIPVFLLTYLLRRHYLRPQALQVLVDVTPKMLDDDLARFRHLPNNVVFIIFARLLRHAREVAPVVMQIITKLLLTYLQKVRAEDDSQLSNLTIMLNRAMQLISLPTAEHPFLNVVYQEAALVQVLRFMAEHQPQLQITQEGYRAVVRIQLTQGKTPNEQQWAELKALSWPPWKQDRTAMDADVTAETHGFTIAATTLKRSFEAGYSPSVWEQSAKLLAGWDIDGTPTVQTRAILGSDMKRFRSSAPVWAARITSTRTAQEAWAAYLAYEVAELPANDEVHLAISQKLYEEERRQRDGGAVTQTNMQRRRQVLPGDAREVQPLPPSTHLYTYTRTPVPSVDGFVKHLREREICLRGHALAFAVTNAAGLRLGLSYLQHGSKYLPEISNLLSFDARADTTDVPDAIFIAFIELLCRYSNVPLNHLNIGYRTTAVHGPRRAPLIDARKLNPNRMMGDRELNLNHPLVHGLELLRGRSMTSRQPWNAVLQALTRDASVESMRFLHVTDSEGPSVADDVTEHARGTMLALSLVKRTLGLLADLHVDAESQGLHYLCIATENHTVACWTLLRSDLGPDDGNPQRHVQDRKLIQYGVRQIQSGKSHTKLLRSMFGNLVNVRQSPASPTSEVTQSTPAPPDLLHVPSAALLHAYVRAMGWAGDYEGLQALLKWMLIHHGSLRAQHQRERNGPDLFRRTIVAFRVFLERSWLHPKLRKEAGDSAADGLQESGDRGTPARSDARLRWLHVLEAPAPAEAVADAEKLVGGVADGKGWPSDWEVEQYVQHERFEKICNLSV